MNKNTIGLSPTPQIKPTTIKPTGMSFPEAMKAVVDGKRIHKLEWEKKEFFGEMKDGFLELHKPDGKYYQWIINDGDMLGTDWIVV